LSDVTIKVSDGKFSKWYIYHIEKGEKY
jgi:LEA14-like dessication related protein